MALDWFGWLSGRHRKRVQRLTRLAQHFIPLHVAQWQHLDAAQRKKLEAWSVEFCERKNWEGCNGLELTDEMRILISARAGLLVNGWPEPFYFPDVRTILVYPNHFVAPHRMSIGSGMHIETRAHLEGQAWYRGPVIISWEDVVNPSRDTPHNIVVHEFAHQLDMFNGGNADGLPPLPEADVADWRSTMLDTMNNLREICQSTYLPPSVLDCYGCESPAEFFAVSSEAFFEAPDELEQEFPRWFDHLQRFYNPKAASS